MKCSIDGCDRDAMYKGRALCQMHYFRIMRTGKHELSVKTRKYRLSNPAGYQRISKPDHFLADSSGYVYEHRYVIYSIYGDDLPNCALCGAELSWSSCHIDHINKDVSDNRLENLRPLCRGCNVFRGYPAQHTIKGNSKITIDGLTMTASEWSRQEGANFCGASINRRILCGLDPKTAVFGPKKTHKDKGHKHYRKLARELKNGNA